MTETDSSAQSLLLDQLARDPYALYEQSRVAGPVIWMEDAAHWFILGHREAMAVLREPQLTNGHDFEPEHRRSLGQQVLTAGAVERLRPRIRDLAIDFAARATPGEPFDVVDDLASPLTITTICELVGIPAEPQPAIRRWVRTLTDSIDPANMHGHGNDDEGAEQDPEAARPMATIDPPPDVGRSLLELIAERSKAPREDLMSMLLAAESGGQRLTGDEVLMFVIRLLVAGHDTTVSLIANAVSALVEHPTQAKLLRSQPEIMTTALEEFLRFDPPVQLMTRYPLADMEFLGHSLRKGQTIVVNIGAANRDPAVFEAPAELNLTRSPNPHLSFSRGMHFCLGAPLARVEVQEALGALLAATTTLTFAGTPVRRRSFTFRGFDRLDLAVG